MNLKGIAIVIVLFFMLGLFYSVAETRSPGNKSKQKIHDLEDMIEVGREIFFNETFAGNGRSCGTCHPAENNLTIEPKFIATLPPDDPLFVAEFIPELAELEVPELMRKFGLIVENVNGFDKPGVMRSVPHMFSLKLSIGSDEFPPSPQVSERFANATGWSGDGSPVSVPGIGIPGTGVTQEILDDLNIVVDGSLRSFIIGAIIQHYPKTMARIPITPDNPDGDFRLPTNAEMDAIEAFLLSLQRQDEMNILDLDTASDFVDEGNLLFHNEGKCFVCHANGGAINAFGVQGNINTGVENLSTLPAKVVQGMNFLVDDGFGFPGDETFNIQRVLEAADTPPFFHNNAAPTIEMAVAFYASKTFTESPANDVLLENFGSGIELDTSQIAAVAAFLRVINSLENIRLANDRDESTLALKLKEGKASLEVSIADTQDAIEVLTGGEYVLFEEAVKLLSEALDRVTSARQVGIGKRNKLIAEAIALRHEAKAQILE